MRGSPPLVRERPFTFRFKYFVLGITPARAGKTAIVRPPLYKFKDHPRSCGKDPKSASSSGVTSGSPPLVRERPFTIKSKSRFIRITPARAGKTFSLYRRIRHKQDHPRSCGKDLLAYSSYSSNPGSPPLVRERRPLQLDIVERLGITPARAGKTRACRRLNPSTQDHPRSCGKDVKMLDKDAVVLGSPPLVRERLSSQFLPGIFFRITPARAGKTDDIPVRINVSQDHPRSCGKDLSAR